ncbi:MAG: response regulator [Pseudomonadota bacterium]
MSEQVSKRTVFIVEDDAKIAGVLRDYLKAEGHQPRLFSRGSGVVEAVRDDPPAAIILDLRLPDRDGMSICKALRKFSPVPILMLTAQVEERDRLAGLNGGADDYVCKPFSAGEVMARVNAMIRRAEGKLTADQAVNRPYAVDPLKQRVAWQGEWLPLSPAEYVIASAMMNQPGRVFSRDQLLDRLGERSDLSSDRAIDSHMKNIRKKVAAIDETVRCFASVYGVGYRFEP